MLLFLLYIIHFSFLQVNYIMLHTMITRVMGLITVHIQVICDFLV